MTYVGDLHLSASYYCSSQSIASSPQSNERKCELYNVSLLDMHTLINAQSLLVTYVILHV